MNTKIFCDIADIPSIKKFNNKSIVKGFTTNPSLMRKAGAKDYKSYSKQILKFCKKQTSKLPKKLSVLNKIINEKNLARKDCLLLPFITVKKMLKDL